MDFITYDADTLARFVAKAREEGIRLSTNKARLMRFHATSSKPGQPGYAVIVDGRDVMPDKASCTCMAGQNGMACKHGAASINAVRLRRATNAGKSLRRGINKRSAGATLAAAKLHPAA